jgi:hypothetical protein
MWSLAAERRAASVNVEQASKLINSGSANLGDKPVLDELYISSVIRNQENTAGRLNTQGKVSVENLLYLRIPMFAFASFTVVI